MEVIWVPWKPFSERNYFGHDELSQWQSITNLSGISKIEHWMDTLWSIRERKDSSLLPISSQNFSHNKT